MGADPITLAIGGMIGGALLGGGVSAYTGQKQVKATQKAMQQQQQQAEKLAVEQQTQYNRLNPKKPNVRVLAGQNEMSGTPETQLTDVLGTMSSDASMGSNSALGGGTGNLNILDLFLQLNRSRGIK